MGIDFQRTDYEAALPDWQIIDRAADERNLEKFLPELNAHDTSPQNKERNAFYRDRASWFGATAITLQGLIGVAYEDAPEIDLPAALEYMRENADGTGVSLEQQMHRVTEQVLRKGRVGLFVTFPKTEGNVSLADVQRGRAVATIHAIDAKRIVNWWTVQDGGRVKIGGVVFSDTEQEIDDYKVKDVPIYRELALDDAGNFFDRVWRKNKADKWVPDEPVYPRNGAGQLWQEIPFAFCGAVDNTHTIDRPPMLALARLNRDYYRNSADFEESLFFAGQAQPFLKPADGLGLDDIQKAKDSGFYIGSRELIIGEMGFAQSEPNSAIRQAMIDKIEAMKALGARFVMPGSAVKTATQAAGESKVQHSVLSLISVNVEGAYNKALNFAGAYMNSEPGLVALSRDFMDPEATPEMMDRLIALLDRGMVGPGDAMPVLKRAKFLDAEKTIEDYSEELAERGVTFTEPDAATA